MVDRNKPILPGSWQMPEVVPHRFGFLIITNFPLIPFAAATETLRMANWLTESALYEWYLISEDGAPVHSSNGLMFTPHASIDSAPPLDDLIVLAGGRAPPETRNKRLFHWLQRLARNGCRIGAAGLGSFILARAGLLDGHRCTVHWKLLPNFRSEFPKLEVTGELYEIDRARHTSSGGTGTLDVMLALISAQHGVALASKVGEEFIHERIRPSHHEQRMSLRHRLNVVHPKVLKAVKIMEESIEEPITCKKVAIGVGVSVRQLEKLFRKYLNNSPNDFYRKLRLDQSRQLLLQTSMSILEIGTAVGFSSPSHFSKAYKAMFGKQPSHDRGQEEAGSRANKILPS
jgi:AraC family transcriptional regulator, glycine betaine-responsive activator